MTSILMKRYQSVSHKYLDITYHLYFLRNKSQHRLPQYVKCLYVMT